MTQASGGTIADPAVLVAGKNEQPQWLALHDVHLQLQSMLAVDGAAMCPETAPARRKLLAAIEAEMSALEHRRMRLRAMLVDGNIPAD